MASTTPGVPEACKAASAHPDSTVLHQQLAASMEKDSLSHTDQQYECMAEIGEVPAYRKVFKDCNLKNGSPFLTLKHLGVQTSEEGMRLSTTWRIPELDHGQLSQEHWLWGPGRCWARAAGGPTKVKS